MQTAKHENLITRGLVQPLDTVRFHNLAAAPLVRRLMAGADVLPQANQHIAVHEIRGASWAHRDYCAPHQHEVAEVNLLLSWERLVFSILLGEETYTVEAPDLHPAPAAPQRQRHGGQRLLHRHARQRRLQFHLRRSQREPTPRASAPLSPRIMSSVHPLVQMLTSYWVSRALYTAARLGVADAIHQLGQGGAVPVEQLAERVGGWSRSFWRGTAWGRWWRRAWPGCSRSRTRCGWWWRGGG